MKFDWPLLDAWLDCGLFQIQTALWRTSWVNDTREYVIVEFRVLRKWGFRLRLYDTSMRMFQRQRLKMAEATRGKLDRITPLKPD